MTQNTFRRKAISVVVLIAFRSNNKQINQSYYDHDISSSALPRPCSDDHWRVHFPSYEATRRPPLPLLEEARAQ